MPQHARSSTTATCRTSSSRSSRATSGCSRPAAASAPARRWSRSPSTSCAKASSPRTKPILRIEPDKLDELLHPTFDRVADARRHRHRPAGIARRRRRQGRLHRRRRRHARPRRARQVILVRIETSPEDIHGMKAAQGILTARGGMTSHAAVVARGMGRCCVAGCGALADRLRATACSRSQSTAARSPCAKAT